MELREIRTFVLAAQVGSFSKAAQILYTTQPTISKQISSLEGELGKALFERDTRSLELTEFGRSFLPYAEEIVKAEVNAMTFVTAKETEPAVFLHMGIARTCGTVPESDLAAALLLGLNAYRSRHREVSVHIDFEEDRDLVQMLRSGRCDLALCPAAGFGDNGASAGTLRHRILKDYMNCLVWNPKIYHTSEAGELLKLSGALGYINDLASIDLAELLMAENGVRLQHRMIHNWYDLLSHIYEGSCVGIIPASLVNLAGRCGLQMLPLEETIYRTSLCLYLSDRSEYTSYAEEVIRTLCGESVPACDPDRQQEKSPCKTGT